MIRPVQFIDDGVLLLDQTKLPAEEIYVEIKDYQAMAQAIKSMVVRGAPAIGVAAAGGIYLGASVIEASNFESFYGQLEEICSVLGATRPTAVNLFWAIERMKKVALKNRTMELHKVKKCLKAEAMSILEEDIQHNKTMGAFGEGFIEDGDTVLTHCNAGALATAGFGTALGVVRAAHLKGRKVKVIADETRPFLQGSRLTAWELQKDGIPVTVISDNMAGYCMRKGMVDLVIVGADRIAANGDVANKIGTYTLALLARQHHIPFYVAAPTSTLDLSTPTGDEIPIEERDHAEVTHFRGHRIAPEGINVFNPAFDVTPNHLIKAIITERGVAEAPYDESLQKIARAVSSSPLTGGTT
jgi:methylthioribose-1-phosphate isomerase